MRRFFEKHDLVKIVFGMIMLTVILTWILPQISFSTGELVKGEITRVGIFDLGLYSLVGVSYFPNLVCFILVLGVFYQFLSKLDAYQNITDSLAKRIVGKEILFSLIVSFVLAVLASMVNEYFVLLTFIPFIITLCSKAGMNKISSFVTTFGAVLVGILGSTINAKIAGINVQFFNAKYTDFLTEKIIFFVVIFAVYSLFNVLYLKKQTCLTNSKKVAKPEKTEEVKTSKSTKSKTTKKTADKKSEKASAVKTKDVKVVKPEEVVEEKTEIVTTDLFANETLNSSSKLAFIIVGVLFVIVLLLAFIPWTSVFELDWFTKAHNWVLNEVKFLGVPIFSYLFGNVAEFGSWDLFTIQIVMIITMLVLSICYRVNLDDLIDSVSLGIRKVGKLVVVLLMAYTVLVLTVYYPVVPTIVNWILSFTDKFNVLTTSLAGIVTNLFTVEYQYTVNMVYANFAQLYANNMNVVSMILQLTYGFVSFFAPSSAILLVGLSYLNIPYKDWMKYIWKFLIIALALVIALAFIIA